MKKILLVLIVVVLLDIAVVTNVVNAINTTKGSKMEVQLVKSSPTLLRRNGEEVVNYVLSHTNDGEKYPAYCIEDESLEWLSNTFSVTVLGELENMNIWKIIANGYPYKSYKELGCANEQEAYMATQGALYCSFDSSILPTYTAEGEAGERTLQALKNILANAKNSKKTKVSSNLKINKMSDDWKQDDIDPNYVSKVYKVDAETQMKNYRVSLKALNGKLPEGIKIVDKNNQEKNEFGANEEFKVIIPSNIVQDVENFEIDAEAQVYTKPMAEGIQGKKMINLVMLGKYENGFGKIEEGYKYVSNTKENKEIKIVENKTLPKTGM